MKLKSICIAVLLGTGLAGTARAELGFPDTVKFSSKIVPADGQTMDQKDIDEADFETSADPASVKTLRGRHFTRWLKYQPGSNEPAPGYYNGTEARIFEAVSAPLKPIGWKLVYSTDDHNYTVLKLATAQGESWLKITLDAPQANLKLEMLEIANTQVSLVLRVPAAQPEAIAAQGDIPYLTPFPGSRLVSAGGGDGPLDVGPTGTSAQEPQLVGSHTLSRTYQGPATLSQLAFMAGYRAALGKAGWRVIYPASAAEDKTSARMVAHYAQGGRDIWAALLYEFGAQISFTVADIGGDDLARQLSQQCHLPLYGVRFDFNQASLQPESDALLTRAAKALQTTTGNIEVQGHTDNVGGDDYNLKLSEARALTVKTWLAQHGVDSARLSSRGYGRSQPIADNGSDLGRAKNRRVELRLPDCTKH